MKKKEICKQCEYNTTISNECYCTLDIFGLYEEECPYELEIEMLCEERMDNEDK